MTPRETRLYLHHEGVDGGGIQSPRADPASDRETQHTIDIITSATATEDGTREELGGEVTGMTVCP